MVVYYKYFLYIIVILNSEYLRIGGSSTIDILIYNNSTFNVVDYLGNIF